MKVLVLNSGSSSVKYKVYEYGQTPEPIAKGIIERIGLTGPGINCSCRLTHWESCSCHEVLENPERLKVKNHSDAINTICQILMSDKCGLLKDIAEIEGIGHRVVHGGEEFTGSTIIDDAVLDGIRKCAKLAPLHNPPAILGIEACAEFFRNTPQVAVFDTAFHHTIPRNAYMYGLPMDYYKEHRIRRYGFHGTSHRYVSRKAIELLDKPAEETRVITCHLGNGCSITAVKGGKAVDTSMGLTPLEGLIMGTRSGDLDPAIPLFLIRELGMGAAEVDELLNKASGLKGICGKADVRDIERLAAEGDEKCALALNMFSYRVARYIGGYTMVMNGVDAIVFTGGIGEHGAAMRARILQNAGYLGLRIDAGKNERSETDISAADSRVRVFVIPTDEESVIASDTGRLVEESRSSNSKKAALVK
ncbi:MAG TPA: acetate kinase [Candidatus Hydrogenedentes bacterium]|nr:acetate kinase [Candidatus Hydrogenedentota bacterium]HQM50711.1 acetate kinase [Candidatus Hydrogenedentota bacterium]